MKNLKILKYFQLKTKLIKNCFNTIINRIKQRFKEYFLSENLFGHLNKLLKQLFIISIGFDILMINLSIIIMNLKT